MVFETESAAGARYEATFTGDIDEFSRVTNQPDPFDGASRVELKFRVEFDEPEPITNTEADLLAELQSELGQTSIDVKVRARGPVEVPADLQQ